MDWKKAYSGHCASRDNPQSVQPNRKAGFLVAGTVHMPAFVITLKAFLCALIVASAGAAVAQGQEAASSQPHTLVLYSYGYGARGVEVFSDGFIRESALLGEGVGDTFFEYLDLERNKDPGYRARLIKFLEDKYRGRNIASIVTIQQPALAFLLAEGKSLAPGAPAITLQAPIPSTDSLQGRKIVSLFARFDMEGTLRAALRIFPSTRRVVFVSGSSAADWTLVDDARKAAAQWSSTITFEYTAGDSIEQIHRRVSSLPPDSIVIFTQYNNDGRGHVAAAYEVEAAIIKEANAPVFGLYDFNLKNGGVGGSVISIENLGIETALLASAVEHGRFVPQDAIIRQEVGAVPMFDWEQVVRWHGNTRALDGDAIVLNPPPGLWEGHRTAVVLGTAVVLVLSSLILALAASGRRMARTREALRESESHFRGVFERIADAVAVSDANHHIVSVNPAFTRHFGYRPEEIIGQPAPLLYADPAMHRETGDRVFDEHAATGSATSEMEARRKDGTTFWCEVQGVTLRDAEGNVAGYMAVGRDITDRKASYLALSRFKAMVDSSEDAIISTSLDGVITSWNGAAERIFGFEAHEAIGQPIEIMLPADLAGEEANIASRIECGERVEHYETVRQRKDGRRVDVSVSIAPILDEAGKVTGASRISRDITEQKRITEALEQHRLHLERMVAERTGDLSLAKAHAETANAAKSSFLARMSHEIRTPMHGIIGLAYLLRRELRDPLHLDRLNKIDKSARHLLALINDILDLSKIEAGRLTLEVADFNLPGVLDDVVIFVGPQAEAKGLKLECRHGDIPQWVRGDATRLRQVLLNYVGNAIKFTEQGCVKTTCHVVKEDEDAFVLRFEVLDTGIGIPADKLASLFRPFEQADTSTSRTYGGTGLGLAINGYLAELMGGEVGVSSTAGEGSLFWFTARLLRAAEAAPEAAVRGTAEAITELRWRHARARVLLVEDNPISAEVAADLVGDAGMPVDRARDGMEAVAMAGNTVYDLVLMDMRMPRMDGLQAARAIRALPGWSHRPIIALSANAFAEDHRRCLEAGMNDFIGKPMQPAQLYQVMLKWLDASHPEANRHTTAAEPIVIETRRGDVQVTQIPAAAGPRAELERIAGLPEMDHVRVMDFSAKADRYIDLLRAMVAGHGRDMNRLVQCLQAGDTKQASELAHSLKGAAAMLGARQLMLAATELDARLRVSPDEPIELVAVDPHVTAVGQAMAALAAGLDRAAG